MKSLGFKGLAPLFIGVASAATTFIPLEGALAGTVRGDARVEFTNVALALDGVSLFPGGFATVQSQADINGVGDQDALGPTACGSTPISVFSSVGSGSIGNPDYASGAATVDCSGAPGSSLANNRATLDLTAPLGAPSENGSGQGTYTTFDNLFTVAPGAPGIVALSGTFDPFLEVEISGFTPGGQKVIEAEYLATFQIRDANGTLVFAAPQLDNNVSLINENGIVTSDPAAVAFAFVTPALAPGNYSFRFSATSRVSGSLLQEGVPEPSALLGLLAIGGMGLLAKMNRKVIKF